MHRRLIALVTAALVALPGTALAADPEGYGRNDAGGFRNVLPPGSDGVDTAAEFQQYLTDGTLPPYWANQQSLYENLLYASPTLTDSQIPDFFKDATFGVRPDDRLSTITPRDGVTIVRDREYAVPRIYGSTRRDTMFGAGYAGAADRLFLMDVLRHTGRADLSSFLGGGNLNSDIEQWRFAPYSQTDLNNQLKQAKKDLGKSAMKELDSFVAGINAYIAEARQNPDLMPVEYSLIGQELRDWDATDVVATTSLVGGIFGRGGGGSLDSSLVLRALEKRFGKDQGRKLWKGFRTKNDPGAPTTIKKRFPYMTEDSFAKKGLALPIAGSVEDAEIVSTEVSAQMQDLGAEPTLFDSGDNGARPHMSNWELVSAKNSRTGNPLAVMGPQVGYWLPQILVEQELHGPGIDARGVAFAGVNLFVQMGHGRDYAWSATSAGSDNVDTFAEVLCGGDKHHYKYKGECRPMEKLVRRNSWTPNVIDKTPAGSAELTSWRTVHGIVDAYGKVKVNGKTKRVAFVLARSTYGREVDSVVGFSDLNNPNKVKDAKSFQRAASGVQFTFNWAYTDTDDTAYFLSGAYPKRANGTSPDFPVLGTGQYDWKGFDPKTGAFTPLEFDRHPKAINPDVLVSWNNKPAPGWSAADEQWGYGPIYRSQLISRRINADLDKGKMTKADLVQSMSEPATEDIRAIALLPLLLERIGSPGDPALQDAITQLRQWRDAGGHRRDLDQDGSYEHNRAIEIMDAWWPRLVQSIFETELGTEAYEAIQSVIGLGAVPRERPAAPGFSDGWWGFVSNDLRKLTDPGSVTGTWPKVFCGDGDRSACRQDLRDSLRTALTVTPQEMYAVGACTSDPQPSCFDKNRPRVTSAISRPGAFPFQNRPTFQQVVSVERDLSK